MSTQTVTVMGMIESRFQVYSDVGFKDMTVFPYSGVLRIDWTIVICNASHSWICYAVTIFFATPLAYISGGKSTIMPKPPCSLARKVVAQRALHSAPSPPVQITTLGNKLRVATESTPGHFSSVGLFIDAGSRYEAPSTSGVSHFIDRMAFKVR